MVVNGVFLGFFIFEFDLISVKEWVKKEFVKERLVLEMFFLEDSIIEREMMIRNLEK